MYMYMYTCTSIHAHARTGCNRSPVVRQKSWTTFVLNGPLFLGGIFLFSHVIRPRLVAFWQLEDWSEPHLCGCWNSLYVAPMYAISQILNVALFQDIADAAYVALHGKQKKKNAKSMHFATALATMLFSLVVQHVLILQALLAGLLPQPYGTIAKFTITSWMAALYCFEYKWIHEADDFNQRMKTFHQHWAYFLGFGVPLTACTIFLSVSKSGALFGLLFPYFVMAATKATPIACDPTQSFGKLCPSSLPICKWPCPCGHDCPTLYSAAAATNLPPCDRHAAMSVYSLRSTLRWHGTTLPCLAMPKSCDGAAALFDRLLLFARVFKSWCAGTVAAGVANRLFDAYGVLLPRLFKLSIILLMSVQHHQHPCLFAIEVCVCARARACVCVCACVRVCVCVCVCSGRFSNLP